MLDAEAAASKSREKIDLDMVEQVIALALEPRVRLLLNLKHHVSRQTTGHLVTLAAEVDLVAVPDTLINVDVEDLALHNGLLAVAALAAILVADNLTLAVAVGAHGLEALDHGAHLAHHGLHTGATATGTRFDGAFLAAAAITTGADDRLLQSQLRDLAAVDILQVDLVNVVDRPRLLRALLARTAAEHASEGATAAAEELGEQILRTHATTHATTFETLFTVLVVDRTLLGIREDLVGVGHLLELLGRIGVVLVLVWKQGSSLEYKVRPQTCP